VWGMTVIPVGRVIVGSKWQGWTAQHRVATRSLVATGCAIGLAAAVGILEAVWPLRVAAIGVRSAIETAITLSAIVSVVLLLTRRGETRLRDLLLLSAVVTVSLTDFVFNALPAVGEYRIGMYGEAARETGLMIGTSMFVAAAFVPTGRWVRAHRRLLWLAALGGISALGFGALIDVVTRPSGIGGVAPTFEPLLTTLALGSFCALLIGGFGFASKWGPEDRHAGLVVSASFLLAGASLALALPLAPTAWVTPVELFRVVAYACLLAAGLQQYMRTRDRVSHEAVCAERIRIAHDLHDGLAQDLAFIVAYADRSQSKLGEGHPLVIAARRALAASRGTIVDLEASQAPSVAAALREVAAELEARFEVKITVRVGAADDPEPSPTDRRELVRIAREAIVNAVSHGGAQNVAVTLGARHGDLLLSIRDDGFGPGDPASLGTVGIGLGMRTMRARAWALGGQLTARPIDDGGTEIAVVPSDRGTEQAA